MILLGVGLILRQEQSSHLPSSSVPVASASFCRPHPLLPNILTHGSSQLPLPGSDSTRSTLLSRSRSSHGSTHQVYPHFLRPSCGRRCLQNCHLRRRRRSIPRPGQLHRVLLVHHRHRPVPPRRCCETPHRCRGSTRGDARGQSRDALRRG